MKNSICLVATYKEFAQLARDLKSELNLPIDILEGSLEEGTRQAMKAEKAGAKIIISRGGTASMIRQHVKIPVVEIRVTGYDVFRNIYPVAGPGRVLGILGYQMEKEYGAVKYFITYMVSGVGGAVFSSAFAKS